MHNLSGFCTCQNLDCPLHPTRHDKGCTPCISKNLGLSSQTPTVRTSGCLFCFRAMMIPFMNSCFFIGK
ncbi:MAG: DUF6485 family protein [Bilifractor sp.]